MWFWHTAQGVHFVLYLTSEGGETHKEQNVSSYFSEEESNATDTEAMCNDIPTADKNRDWK